MSNYYYKYFNNYGIGNDTSALFKVIEKGIELMTPNLKEALFQSWQEYAKAVVKIYSENKDNSIYINYLTFIISISGLPPYQKLKTSIEYLMNIVRMR